MSKIELRGVSKAYGATLALRRGDLSIDAGEVHVLIGSNGSGKSTLCKILAGSVRPDGGEILIDGKPVTITGPRSARDHGIGIFYQELSLAGHRTVAENICLPDLPATRAGFVDRAALDARAARYIALFEAVAGEGFAAETAVENLRADQRQLVEIMKALATEAPVIIFDEPTSALDRAQVDRFFDILRDLKAQGRSIIFISHRMDEIFAIGDRVTVIRDGETVGTENISETNPSAVIRMMVGGQDELAAGNSAPPAAASTARVPVLTAKGLSGKGFANVGFEVAKGEILGFGGLHGRLLERGDRLPLAPTAAIDAATLGVPVWWIDASADDRPRGDGAVIRVLPGADCTEPADALFARGWTVAADSNRQGLRLGGEALAIADRGERVSEPVVPGTLQLPPDGTPIVLLADAQTHGGYPRIGHAIRADWPLLAQLRPGDRVRFVACTPEAARLALCRQRQRLHRIALALDAKRPARA